MLYFKFNDEKLVGKTYHLRELVVGVNQYDTLLKLFSEEVANHYRLSKPLSKLSKKRMVPRLLVPYEWVWYLFI